MKEIKFEYIPLVHLDEKFNSNEITLKTRLK